MDNQIVIQKKGLSANVIKYIAIFAMVFDHVSWGFVPENSVIGILMHIIGRFTAPIMCYFIAEGYHYTKNVKKYAGRLAIFALISQLPFNFFFHKGHLTFMPIWENQLSMIFTLLCGLLALWAWDKMQNKALRILTVSALCLVTAISDWRIFSVLFILAFGNTRDNKKKQLQWFAILTVIKIIFDIVLFIVIGKDLTFITFTVIERLGIFCVIPILSLYNGQRGKGGKFNKWFFYIFYPLHLLILGIVLLFIS